MKNGISAGRRAALSVALLSASFCALSQTSNQNSGARLPDVIVNASRFAESSSALPYGVSIITAEQIESSGASSVSEAIMKVLGVPGRLDLSGANNYALDLRGFGQTSDSNQVVIVDGHRLNEQDTSATALGSISIDQVQRIEILRGSAAVLYGEGATAGVIIVTTKLSRGVERPNSALVSATFGSFGTLEGRASATLSEGGFSLDIASRNRESDGHRDNFASANTGLGVSAQWANDWLRVGAKNSRSATRSGLPGGITSAEFDANPRFASDPLSYAEIKSDISMFFLEAIRGDWQFGVDITQRKKQIQSNYIYPDSSSRNTYVTDASSVNSRARYEFKRADFENAITFGIDHEEWIRADSPTSYAPASRADSNSDGVYINDDITFAATGTRLSAGLRGQNISRSRNPSGTGVSDAPNAWSIGFTQELIKPIQIYGRTGTSFRMANSDEFNFVVDGATLKTQSAKDLELGLRFLSDSTRAELRWYRSALTNEIALDQNAIGPWGPGGGANVNLDPTEHRGVELEGYHALTEIIALRLNLASKQAQFVSGIYANNMIALVPSNTVALGADFKSAPGHRINVGLTWVSNQYADFENKCTIPAYSTVNARYIYSNKSMELGLGVSNLGDSNYFTQGYGCAKGAVTSIFPEPGRAFSATAKLKF